MVGGFLHHPSHSSRKRQSQDSCPGLLTPNSRSQPRRDLPPLEQCPLLVLPVRTSQRPLELSPGPSLRVVGIFGDRRWGAGVKGYKLLGVSVCIQVCKKPTAQQRSHAHLSRLPGVARVGGQG